VVAQQKFCRNIQSLPFTRRYSFFKLDRYAGFNHLPVVRAYCFGNIMGENIEIGFPADLVALDAMAALVFPVNQHITEFKILDEHHGRSVINHVLQALFALAKCILGPSAFRECAKRHDSIRQVIR